MQYTNIILSRRGGIVWREGGFAAHGHTPNPSVYILLLLRPESKEADIKKRERT